MRLRHALGGSFLGLVVAATFAAGCSATHGAGESTGQLRSDLGGKDGSTVIDAGPQDDGSADDGDFDSGQTGVASGEWTFDDCSATSTSLADSSGNGDSASHRLASSCVAGVDGLGIAFESAKDVVTIPDGPQFALTDRVAVAVSIHPKNLSGHQPIVIKELGGEAAFELALQGGDVVFSARLATGKTVTSKAPVSAKVWSHVGAFFDGQFAFLFVNGQQVGQVEAPGALGDVKAPIRVGASAEGEFFDGVLDEVWISTNQVAASDIQALSCIARPATLSVTQSPTGPVQVGTTVNYSVAVTNQDVGFCQPDQYFFNSQLIGQGGGGGGGSDGGAPPPLDGGVSADAGFVARMAAKGPPLDAGPPDSGSPDGGSPTGIPIGLQATVNTFLSPSVSPGQSFTFDVTAAATVDTDPGDYALPFQIFSEEGTFLSGSLDFDLGAPSGCFVTTGRELMVIDPSVVDDPVRTAFTAPSTNKSRGVWTFGRLMRDMAPTAAEAPAFTLALFQSWLTDQTVNGFTVSARPAMQQTVLDGWPRLKDGSLDLDKAPLRLLAIVNRIDQRDLAAGNAGESRFVFGVLDSFGNPLQFTVIAEYALLATTEAQVLGWASSWHALGALPFPSEQYNAALEALTLQFSGRGVAPGRPNGNGLDQLRTNEIALSFQWELRQFGLTSAGALAEETISLNPDLSFDGTTTLAKFVNQNRAAILAATDVVPDTFGGAAFLGGSVFNNLVTWSAPGIRDNDARFDFSSNTCNGCHGVDTNTQFLQIAPRSVGQEAVLAGFLTGTTAVDQVSGQPRPFNDLARRNADLASLVCTGGGSKAPAGTSVAKGIRRTH